MGLTMRTVKQVLLILNFFSVVLGLILIGFGIFILISAAQNAVDIGENFTGSFVIALGVVIIIIAIFGYMAAIHEARHRVLIYVISLAVLILIQLMMLSMASHGTKDGLAGSIEEGFEKLWQEEMRKPGALHYYEDWLHCCGVNGTDDYRKIHHEIPPTCCIVYNCVTALNPYYNEGCQQKFETYLYDKLLTFKIVCWLLILGEGVAAFFGWVFFSSLKNQSRRDNVGWM